MYVENGIAYAGEKAPLLKVCGVRPLPGHRLWVRFNTGEEKTVDLSPFLLLPAYQPLMNAEIFNSVYIDYGVPVWNNGDIDIAPEALYDK